MGETRTGYSASYGYDGNGNRTFRTVNGVTEEYAYDDGDKLVSITGPSDVREFGYDDVGRRDSESVNGALKRTYSWSDDDRLIGIAHTNPPATQFAAGYDPTGARVAKSDAEGTRAFLRSGPGKTAPVLSDGAATYTPGVSEVRGGVSTFVTGGLKNQDAQWSSAGALMATRTYDAFGNLVGSSGSWNGPFGYGGAYGYQEDASGLKLLGHRYYDPSTGSFLSRDPIKDGRNWYAYCAGDPVGWVDPDGLSRVGESVAKRGKEKLGSGPFDCGKWLRMVYTPDIAMPPGVANTWDDWFAESPRWKQVENEDGAILQEGDVMVIDRTGIRGQAHGHVMMVGVDGEIYDASLGTRQGTNQGKQLPKFTRGKAKVTIWRPLDPK